MRKLFTLSRLAALLLTAIMALPLWADGNPIPEEWNKDAGYTEETPVNLQKEFPIGTQFNIIEEFPALAGKTFFVNYGGNYYNIPASDNQSVCVFGVSVPQWASGHQFDVFTLGDGYCIAGGDAHMTVWSFDYYYDDLNLRNIYTKKYTYNITIHVSNKLQPGYAGGSEADPTAIHDIKMYEGEKRENWITFYACQASYFSAYEENPAYLDVHCDEVTDEYYNQYPTLTSSDASIVQIGTASYNSNLPTLEALAPGTVTITVTSIDPGEYYTQATKTFKVTVMEGGQQHPGEGGLHFTNLNRHDPDNPLFSAYTGHEFALPTLVNETGLPNSELQFSSDNPSVATIDGNGVISLTGAFGETRISVEQKYHPKYHSDRFVLVVSDPFSVMGSAVSPSQYNDILNDGGSLKYNPETHTFTMTNLHKNFLAGHSFTEDEKYHFLHDDINNFIDWYMEDDVNIHLVGKNEILNANRIVQTDTTVCHNVSFTGNGSLYAKIYFTSFVNGVRTNAVVRGATDYREAEAEGDITTNITIDGASVTVDRDVTYDLHYPNFYSQVISGNKLKVINNGYIHAHLIGSVWGISRAKAVISLKELETDATTDLYSYLEWDTDPFGYNYDDPNGKIYMSRTFKCSGGWAIEFETGPTINVAKAYLEYDFGSQDPGTSGDIMFKNSAAAEYTGSSVVMYSGYTDDEVESALKTIGPGTESWYNTLPGALTVYLSQGSGSFSLYGYVYSGYLLKVMIVDGDKTHISCFAPAGYTTYTEQYKLENDSYAVIYLQQETPSGAPARRAPQQKYYSDPHIYLWSLNADPDYVGPMVTVTAKQDPDAAGNYYATFYYENENYRLSNDGTEAYYATIDANGNLQMTLVAENTNVILKDHAVILKATKPTIGLIPEFSTPTYPVKPEANTAANQLQGVDIETAAPANCYVLSGRSADGNTTGVGFYEFSGTLAAHKAYLTYGGAGAPQRMRFIFNNEQQATGLDNTNSAVKSEKRIEDGQLIIIKNGVRYNAQGQIVK